MESFGVWVDGEELMGGKQLIHCQSTPIYERSTILVGLNYQLLGRNHVFPRLIALADSKRQCSMCLRVVQCAYGLIDREIHRLHMV